ncbi:MAG: hypothetical protein H0T62_01650 [Parachlamydiaceae bacterium]|nr:hypothetical protein [Parachlamydiaceae bacterium]
MVPIKNFQKEAENETVFFEFSSNNPYPGSRANLTVTVDQIIKGWAYQNVQENVYVPRVGMKMVDVQKAVYFSQFFSFGKEKLNCGTKTWVKDIDTSYFPGFYYSMAKATAKKLIEINLAHLILEDNEKNAKAELLNVKNLLIEEQVNSQMAQSSIEILEIAKVNVLNDLNLLIIEKNQIRDELDQEHLKNEEAQSIIHEQKALVKNQNAEISLLKQTMDEMATMITSLKDEKLKYSIENISLESKFKTEKIEYKRRLKNHEEMNSHLLTDLRQKKHELTEITSELSRKTFELGEHKKGNSKICSEDWKQHFDSQQESYATSDDEGEICLTSLK